jgi:hypothetical protein
VALHADDVLAQPTQDELAHRGVAQVQQVACPVEAVPAVLDGDRVAPGVLSTLEDPMRDAAAS